ncbi:hypothetical protein [Trichormus azollae]|uniref:hypothetical protein n=1 Tax=Trichormus azollae TaxID=1164 RepID=UPI00325DDF30
MLGNAIKFTDKGSVKMQVRAVTGGRETAEQRLIEETIISPPTPSHPLCFEVEDTGFGIAPEEFGDLFLVFQEILLEKNQRNEQV